MTPDREALARAIEEEQGGDFPWWFNGEKYADAVLASIAEHGMVLVPASEVEALRALVDGPAWWSVYGSLTDSRTALRAAAPSLFNDTEDTP